jgi:TM2 domain-containing membrane protein YozV
MTRQQVAIAEAEAITIYCSHCGQAMRVAAEHMHGSVACPHCAARLEPARAQSSAHEAATMPYPPQRSAAQEPHSGPRINAYGEMVSRRNRWVAGALAILLGCFGVHRFYLGYTGWGLTQLLITVLSVLTLSWAVAIWAFVEGILCFVGALHDVDGRPLSG